MAGAKDTAGGGLGAVRGAHAAALPATGTLALSSSREKLRYIQLLRTIAIILVVTSHVRDIFPETDVVKSDFVGMLTRHINLVFTFVAGFLFQHLLGSYRYPDYLRKKIRNVILPYLIVSIPAILAYYVGFKDFADLGAPSQVNTNIEYLIFMILTGTAIAPFWFIPMFAILYLLAPLFRAIDARPMLYLVIAPLLVVSCFIGRAPGDTNPLHNALFFAPVYLSGMAVSHFKGQAVPALRRIWPLLILTIFAPLLVEPTNLAGRDALLLLSKMIVCLGLVGAAASMERFVSDRVNILGEISFGIFFVHYYIVAVLAILADKNYLPFVQGIPWFLFLIAAVTLASAMIVLVIKRIAGPYSRRIIGA